MNKDSNSANAVKEMYIINLDISRIFWFVAIGLLIFVFLFLLGYWVGSDNTVVDSYYLDDGANHSSLLHSINSATENSANQNPVQNNLTAQRSYTEAGADAQEERNNNSLPNQKEGFDDFELDVANTSVQSSSPTQSVAYPPNNSQNILMTTSTPDSESSGAVRQVSTNIPASTPNSFPSSAGKYTIQVSSHTSSASANELQNKLKKLNFDAYVQSANINGKVMYRIRVGHFNSKEEANKVLSKLHKLDGIQDITKSFLSSAD